MATGSRGKAEIFRLSVKPTGEARSKKKIQEDVAAALEEALTELRKDPAHKTIRAKAAPEGAFVGVAVATVWVLKTFGAGVLTGAGTVAGKKLVENFFKALRSRKLDPGPATSVVPAKRKKKRSTAKRGKRKK
jgi:hypothetical protein